MVKKPSKKTTKASSSAAPPKQPEPVATPPPAQPHNLDSKHQQLLLNIFSEAFESVLASAEFPTLLQEIKQALFNRDFAAAFGREDYLEAYAARWAPTRALCYASVLKGLYEHLGDIMVGAASSDAEVGVEGVPGQEATVEPAKRIKMLSIGGCASEHVAFASYLHHSHIPGTISLLDSAPWANVANSLQSYITSPPRLSKYASAAAKASNAVLVEPSQLHMTFQQQDILQLDKDKLAAVIGAEPLLVTILFTLNELYTSGGIAKTTKFLSALGQVLPDKSLFLVLDSPGSYSEAALGKEKRKYPMQWLLDHTLLETDTSGYKWERLESHDSLWFRLPEDLSYPMQLENMRYQMHLYRIDREAPTL